MSSHSYYHAIAFISDIHANLEALEAVLEDIERQNVSTIYCLGDIVGYGADPQACLRKIRELQLEGKLVRAICGNHDYGVVHNDFKSFNEAAKLSNEWTREVLKDTPEFLLLKELTEKEMEHEVGRFHLVHSSINPEPKQWAYIRTKNAKDNFLERKILFVGHTHIPALYSKYSAGKVWNPISLFEDDGFYFMPKPKPDPLSPGDSVIQYRLQLSTFPTLIVNVGSVGMPRDDNPSARYVLYLTIDYTDYIEYRQVGYDIQKTVEKLEWRELPCEEELATRLVTGGRAYFDKKSPRPKWFPFSF